MKLKHFVWDYDGTLYDSYPAMAGAFCAALEGMGICEPADIVMSHMKVSMGDAARHYRELYALDDAFFERFNALRNDAEEEGTKPFDGVMELCRALYESGGQHYLFTHRGASALHFMDKFGLTPYFTEMITSQRRFARKPSPDAILYLMDTYAFARDEAIMIGDRALDIDAAGNAGIRACYFSQEGDRLPSADYNITCFAELYALLGIDRG